MKYTGILLSVIWYFQAVHSHPDGAPTSKCASMIPSHGSYLPKTDPSPYKIEAVKESSKQVSVRITSVSKLPFKGFLLEARNSLNPGEILGTFEPRSSDVHTIPCAGADSALTQNTKKDVQEINTVWTAPKDFKGSVYFQATVVKSFTEFFANVTSSPLGVEGDKGKDDNESGNLYEKCGKEVGCFGLPQNCIKNNKCNFILTYVKKGDNIMFEIQSVTKQSENSWVAAALSFDDAMGKDIVAECLALRNGSLITRSSWNKEGKGVKDNMVLSAPPNGVEFTSTFYSEGVVTCSWKQRLSIEAEGVEFDVLKSKFYLLMAQGVLGNNLVKNRHTATAISGQAVNLTEIAIVSSDEQLFIKLHGSFMVFAWLLTVSLGILLARHYKQVWESTNICGVKVWFACHRTLMVISLLFIIAATVLIFKEIGGWSYGAENWHPILGCISTGLAVIQPIMAIFRPDPKARRRPIFNWLHWFVGNGAQIVAVATIFLALDLSKSGLNQAWWFIYLLIGFVAFHVLVHLIMQFHAWLMEKKMPEEIKMHELDQRQIQEPMKDAPGGGFRRFILGIYTFIIIALVAGMIATIWTV